MAQIKHICSECESKFYIVYDLDECEDSPGFCPFCAANILDLDFSEDEEEL